MADYVFYWKHFAKDRKRGDWPVGAWYSNDDSLAKKLAAGDRLWYVAGGDTCGQPEHRAAYLAQVLLVQKVIRNPGEDREYPTNQFHYMIVVDPEKRAKLDPPVLADDQLRPPGHDKSEPIGQLMQRPRKLSEETVAALRTLLEASHPDAAKLVSGE
jgi:hypothetical protein